MPSPYGYYAITAATSLHPGGVQLRVLRRLGPVHQEDDRLLDLQHQQHPGGQYPPRRRNYANYVYSFGAQLGVYQQLSTRAGGEVISSDSY